MEGMKEMYTEKKPTKQDNPDDKADVKRKVTWILLFIILFSTVERMHQSNFRQRQIIA